MAEIEQVGKPQRWDKPFAHQRLLDEDVERVLALPLFQFINEKSFPDDLPLREIVANDGRIVRYQRGEIIVRKGDYGSSFFVILKGSVKGIISAKGEEAITYHTPPQKRNLFGALSQLWLNSRIPEYLGEGGYRWTGASTGKSDHVAYSSATSAVSMHEVDLETPVHSDLRSGDNVNVDQLSLVAQIKDVDNLIAADEVFEIQAPEFFGELSALARSPRSNTIFAESDETVLLELRWQGLRDIREWSENVHKTIDDLYRERGLGTRLRECELFKDIDDDVMEIITQNSLFETYGNFDWTHRYQQRKANDDTQIFEHEPLISEQDHYLDGLLLLHSGFARVSEKFDHGEKTVGYLTKDDIFGLEEIAESERNQGSRKLKRSLRAIGYVDVIRIPTQIVVEYVLPNLKQFITDDASSMIENDSGIQQSMLDFLVDNRFINGTKSMVINTDRCVSCDDCVRACSAAHDNNPRFVRHGASHQNLMIANACMHCKDPVCLIGCPTGAIHRDIDTGSVVIDSVTCVGCATCANSCPYDNIRMVEIRDDNGSFLTDERGEQIYKATKCDLCADQMGGPACQRACPHDALIRVDLKHIGKISDWLGLSQ